MEGVSSFLLEQYWTQPLAAPPGLAQMDQGAIILRSCRCVAFQVGACNQRGRQPMGSGWLLTDADDACLNEDLDMLMVMTDKLASHDSSGNAKTNNFSKLLFQHM